MIKKIRTDKETLESLFRSEAGDCIHRTASATLSLIGGELNAETMPLLEADQITLIAYDILLSEVSEGGFIQLIHNGYGPFIFENPFAKALYGWGLKDLRNLIYDVRRLYEKTKDFITGDCSDEEFMALYEKYEKYDDFDDEFVDKEPEYSAAVAAYLSGHTGNFFEITE